MEINTKTMAYRRCIRALHDLRDGENAEKAAWAKKVLADAELFKQFFHKYCAERYGIFLDKQKAV